MKKSKGVKKNVLKIKVSFNDSDSVSFRSSRLAVCLGTAIVIDVVLIHFPLKCALSVQS